jgi:hypothetical protein
MTRYFRAILAAILALAGQSGLNGHLNHADECPLSGSKPNIQQTSPNDRVWTDSEHRPLTDG